MTAEKLKRPPAMAARRRPAEEYVARPQAVEDASQGKSALHDNAARVFDSDKENRRKSKSANAQTDQPAPAKAVRPPESDAAAQVQIRAKPRQVRSVISEEGRRIKLPRKVRPEIPAGAELVREVNNRFIVQVNNDYFVERPREGRIIADAREVYYEELPRSRQREVVVRRDGTRIITIRNRYGDVIRRVKVLPTIARSFSPMLMTTTTTRCWNGMIPALACHRSSSPFRLATTSWTPKGRGSRKLLHVPRSAADRGG